MPREKRRGGFFDTLVRQLYIVDGLLVFFFMKHIRYKKRAVSDAPDSNESDSEEDKHGIFSDVNDGSDSDNDVDIDDHWKEIADNRLN